MKRYTVKVERTVVHSAYIEVSADNDDEAASQAEALAEKSHADRFEWELESEGFESTDVEELFDEEEDEDDEA